MHADAEVHATEFRKGNCAPTGVGMGWMLQALPFHCSARFPALELPTAVHADEDTHATPSRNAPPCAGLAVVRVLQELPFHSSASVPVPVTSPPTAMHIEDDVQATPDRKSDPLGLGVGWICQLVPSHRSASASLGVAGTDPPTAVHAAAEVHDTPTK